MAIALRTSTSIQVDFTTSTTITIPSATQVDDVMLLFVGVPGVIGTDNSLTTPTGWTVIQSGSQDATSSRRIYHYSFYRVAVAGDAGSSVTLDIVGNEDLYASMLVYSGVYTTSPIDVSGKQSGIGNGSDANLTAPSVTTTFDGDRIVEGYFESSSSTDRTITTPATQRTSTHASNVNGGGGTSDQSQSTGGATGTKVATSSVTMSTSECWAAHTVALRDRFGALAGTSSLAIAPVTRSVQVAFSVDPGTTPVTTNWTELSTSTRQASIKRGRSSEWDQFNAGTAAAVLDNRTRQFDPDYTSSPYYPNVKPMRRIRFRTTFNLLTENQASLETDTTGWAANNSHSTISRTTAQFADGVASLALTTADAANSQLLATTPTGTSGFAVTAGKVYTAVASYRTAATARSMRVEITFYNSAGAQLSTTAGTALTDSTTIWQQAFVTETAPANSRYARILVGSAVGTPASGEVHYVDKIGVFLGSNPTWVGYYDLFQGFVERWPQTWAIKRNEAAVPITAVDGFAGLRQKSLRSTVLEQEIATDSPTYWWKLDETSGSTAVENVSRAYNGIYASPTLGVASIIAGSDGTAVTFDQGTYLNVPGLPSVSQGTVELWFKSGTVAGSQPTYLFGSGSMSAKLYDGSAADPGFLSVIFDQTVPSTVRLDNNVVHHLVISATASNFTVYVDGASLGTGTHGGGFTLWGNGKIAFNDTDGGGTAPTIQNIVLYSSALSSARVTAHYNAGLGTEWANELTSARVTRLLDIASVASGDRNVDTGISTMSAASLGGSVLSEIQEAERAEQGAFFVQSNGKFRFRSRHSPLTATVSNTSQATFGDANDGAEIPYVDIELTYDIDRVFNEVYANRVDGEIQVARDVTSATTYWPRTDDSTLTDLEITSDREARDAADWRLAHYKDPATRVERIVIKPRNLAQWDAVLSREIGDRVTVNRRPPGGGSAISKEVLIEGIEHEITPDDWSVTFYLSPADTQSYWIWDTSTWDTTTRWGY